MTVKPSTIFTGDNLEIMRGMDDESIDLIYLDPPFNSNRNYAAPIGSAAAGAAFKDTWTLSDLDNAWHGEIADKEPGIYSAISGSENTHGKGMKAYLIMMAVRFLEMRRILKSTGSIYLHCDSTASHYLKILMDGVFGKNNFKNEIVWCYTGPSNTKKYFPKKHDTIFFYTKTDVWVFNADALRIEYQKMETGKTSGIFKQSATMDIRGKIPEDYWLEKRDGMTPVGRRKNERVGYPTQKPLALLKRIIKASSNEGDIILDPFCGCATACLAAQIERRKWIGIDISPKAYQLINERLERELGGVLVKPIHRKDIPHRKGVKPSKDIKHKLFGQQEGQCNGCKETFNFRNFQIDHIIPKAKGGADSDDNLQLLCGWCNSKKGDRPMEYLIAELKGDGIYDQRQTKSREVM